MTRRVQSLGLGVAAAGAGGAHPAGAGRVADGQALPPRRAAAAEPGRREPALLPAAHDAAHVHRAGGVGRVRLRVRGVGGQGAGGRKSAGAAAGHPAVHPHPRLPGHRGGAVHRAVPGQPVRRGAGGAVRDLHVAGLEHGVQPLPVAAHRAGRAAGSGAHLPAVGLAEVLAAGVAVRDAQPAVEHDDEHVRRLVLRRRVRGHLRGGAGHQAARRGLVHRRGHRGARPRRHRLGHPRHADRHPAVRPAVLPAAAGLGRQVPVRRRQQRQRAAVLAADLAAPHRAAAEARCLAGPLDHGDVRTDEEALRRPLHPRPASPAQPAVGPRLGRADGRAGAVRHLAHGQLHPHRGRLGRGRARVQAGPVHAGPRDAADRRRVGDLGAHRRVDRPEPAHRRPHAGGGAVPRRLPVQPGVPGGGAGHRQVPAEPGPVAVAAHHPGHAVVPAVQRRRGRVHHPDRAAPGRAEPRPEGLAGLEALPAAGHLPELRDRRHHGQRRLVERQYRGRPALGAGGRGLHARQGRDRRAAGPVGLGQEHAAAHHGRADPGGRGRRALPRPAAVRAGRRHRDGVPELRAVPVANRAAERRAGPGGRWRGRSRAGAARRGRHRADRSSRLRGRTAARAVGRHAPARGHRAGAGDAAGRAADGRGLLGAGRADRRASAPRDPGVVGWRPDADAGDASGLAQHRGGRHDGRPRADLRQQPGPRARRAAHHAAAPAPRRQPRGTAADRRGLQADDQRDAGHRHRGRGGQAAPQRPPARGRRGQHGEPAGAAGRRPLQGPRRPAATGRGERAHRRGPAAVGRRAAPPGPGPAQRRRPADDAAGPPLRGRRPRVPPPALRPAAAGARAAGRLHPPQPGAGGRWRAEGRALPEAAARQHGRRRGRARAARGHRVGALWRGQGHAPAGPERCHRRHPHHAGQAVPHHPPHVPQGRRVHLLRAGQVQVQPRAGPPQGGAAAGPAAGHRRLPRRLAGRPGAGGQLAAPAGGRAAAAAVPGLHLPAPGAAALAGRAGGQHRRAVAVPVLGAAAHRRRRRPGLELLGRDPELHLPGVLLFHRAGRAVPRRAAVGRGDPVRVQRHAVVAPQPVRRRAGLLALSRRHAVHAGRRRGLVARVHRAQGLLGAVVAGAGTRRRRAAGAHEERLPRDDEPRDPHAAERRAGHERAADRQPAGPGAAQLGGRRARLRPAPAGPHQRRAGRLPHRGRPAAAGRGGVRAAAGVRGRAADVRAAGSGQGADAAGDLPAGAGRGARARRPAAAAPDRRQPGR
ncbi:unnamed protein product [Rotaria sp. Silwood1]|nr:unnamed protein product [Rotaria sp. Silwood1]